MVEKRLGIFFILSKFCHDFHRDGNRFMFCFFRVVFMVLFLQCYILFRPFFDFFSSKCLDFATIFGGTISAYEFKATFLGGADNGSCSPLATTWTAKTSSWTWPRSLFFWAMVSQAVGEHYWICSFVDKDCISGKVFLRANRSSLFSPIISLPQKKTNKVATVKTEGRPISEGGEITVIQNVYLAGKRGAANLLSGGQLGKYSWKA